MKTASRQAKPIEQLFAEAEAHGFCDFRLTREGIEWGEPHGAWCPDCNAFKQAVRKRYAEARAFLRQREKADG